MIWLFLKVPMAEFGVLIVLDQATLIFLFQRNVFNLTHKLDYRRWDMHDKQLPVLRFLEKDLAFLQNRPCMENFQQLANEVGQVGNYQVFLSWWKTRLQKWQQMWRWESSFFFKRNLFSDGFSPSSPIFYTLRMMPELADIDYVMFFLSGEVSVNIMWLVKVVRKFSIELFRRYWTSSNDWNHTFWGSAPI